MHPLSSSAGRLPFASVLLTAPSHGAGAVSGCSGSTGVAALEEVGRLVWESGELTTPPTRDPVHAPFTTRGLS